MSLFHRAFLYVVRKKNKTLILFGILLVIATLVLSGIAIKDAAQTAQLNVRQALGGMFMLSQNTGDPGRWKSYDVGGNGFSGSKSYYTGAHLTPELADSIMDNIPGIRGWNARYEEKVMLSGRNKQRLELIEDADGKNDMSALLAAFGDVNQLVNGYGSTDTTFDTYFANGYVKLVEGRHITREDERVAIISQELAQKNGLAVGDTIYLSDAEYYAREKGRTAEDTMTPVEIIGLFSPTAHSSSSMSMSNFSMDNAIFTTRNSLLSARPPAIDEGYGHIYFYVDDPAMLKSIVSEVKKIDGFDPSDFIIDVDDTEVAAVMEPLENMSRLMTILLILIMVVGAAVLYLVLAGRVRERLHESGVLLSLGVGKLKIWGQYLVEAVLIAIVAFSLAMALSGGIAKTVGRQLLDYTLSQSPEVQQKENMAELDGSIVMNGDALNPVFDSKTELTQIDVTVSLSLLVLEFGMGFGLIIVSVTLAALPILRLKPKEILSKMS